MITAPESNYVNFVNGQTLEQAARAKAEAQAKRDRKAALRKAGR